MLIVEMIYKIIVNKSSSNNDSDSRNYNINIGNRNNKC